MYWHVGIKSIISSLDALIRLHSVRPRSKTFPLVTGGMDQWRNTDHFDPHQRSRIILWLELAFFAISPWLYKHKSHLSDTTDSRQLPPIPVGTLNAIVAQRAGNEALHSVATSTQDVT